VREADARVARRALDQRPARLQQALALEVVENAPRRTVLDRAARVQELALPRISQPVSSLNVFRRISGVLPTVSEKDWRIGMAGD